MSNEIHNMFSSVADRYDLTNDVLSFGIHRWWKQKAVRAAKLDRGMTVADLCTGTGDLAFAAADCVGPQGRVLALDLVQRMLSLAKEKRTRINRSRKRNENGYLPISFVQSDASVLPMADKSVDAVTIAFGIRNVDQPLSCLEEIYRILRPRGTLVVLEFGQPRNRLLSPLYRLYSNYVIPLIGALLTGDRAAYEYLPRTSREFPAGQSFLDLLEEAGFNLPDAMPILSGVAYIYVAKKQS